MKTQTTLETVDGATEQNGAPIFMSSKPNVVPRDFLLKQIENEINAGFVFVEAARRAYKQHQPREAGGALDEAARTHRQVSQQVSESPVVQVRAITHQLAELREAIEWLRETIVMPQK